MATQRISWKTVYSELPPHVAEALRTVRVRPEQLSQKSDGEILAIEGINDKGLEAIRAVYQAEIKEDKKPEIKTEITETKEEKEKTLLPAVRRVRSSRYQSAAKKIDKNKIYSLKDALDILAVISKTKHPQTLEMHLNLIETGVRGEAKLPFSTGKEISIEIFSYSTIAKLNANQLDFDMLLTRPADMAKLAKYAKLLGPKGLMPNPKNGTISENPEKRAEELKKGATFAYKSEPKSPLMHLNLGKINQDLIQLEANITAVITAITARKIKAAFLKTTQSPSIKLDLSSL